MKRMIKAIIENPIMKMPGYTGISSKNCFLLYSVLYIWKHQILLRFFRISLRLIGLAALVLGLFACSSARRGDMALATVSRMEEMTDLGEDYTGYADLEDRLSLEKKASGTGEEAELELARQLATTDENRIKTPELLSRVNGSDLEPLPLVIHDIYVVITGHKARVIYDMIFENSSSRQLSGNIMIPLPRGASPSYLGMFQGRGFATEDPGFSGPGEIPGEAQEEKRTEHLGLKPVMNPRVPEMDALLGRELEIASRWETQEGEIDWGELRYARVTDPVKGRQVYEAVTRQQIDPALSEWAGSNKFSTRVFPIPPSGYKRILFAYDRTLDWAGDQLIYPLPLPEEPAALTRVTLYALEQGFSRTTLSSSRGEITSREKGNARFWQFRVDSGETPVFSALPRDPRFMMISGESRQIEGKLVHLRIKPEVPVKESDLKTGKALFLLDTSYSTKDKIYAGSARLFREILEKDDTITQFALVGFDVLPRPLEPGFLENTPANRQKAFKAVESVWLEGATNFASLLELLRDDPAYAYADSLFLLSDGYITWGPDNTAEMKRAFPSLLEKPWYCYSFGGSAVNRELFEILTHESGQWINLAPGQEFEDAALAHRREQSRLDWVNLPGSLDFFAAGEPARLYPGQILDIGARCPENSSSQEVSLGINGQEQKIQVPLQEDPLTRNIGSRSWAELYVNRLLSLYNEKADEMALALSQHFVLTGRQGSFIILETDQEYERHAITPGMLEYEALLETVEETVRPYGAPDLSVLSGESRELIALLETGDPMTLYSQPSERALIPSFETLFHSPGEQERTPEKLYLLARELYNSSGELGFNKALRVLSGIIEEKPRDDQAARLVGYVLLEWGLYEQALELFSRVRQRRPFEPQNYLMEGLALTFLGRLDEAAGRFELLLQRNFDRFETYTTPVTLMVYATLLDKVARRYAGTPLGEKASTRREQLAPPEKRKGRLLLFWNLDDTDVDLHVKEGPLVEVYYENMTSLSGGRLYWDNTTGLGPEMYDHPRLSSRGFEVFVNYFGSSSVEGRVPAATLVCAFTEREQETELAFYATVLLGGEEDKIQVMPLWK